MNCRNIQIYLWILLPLICSFAGCRTPQKGKLVWEEEFDGNALDTGVWSKIPRGRSDWNNYMSSFDSCYAVQDGKLILRGLCNLSQPADTAPYLTGGVYTKGKKGFHLGRIEIRAKLNPARGAWPAFWMLPQTGQWPNGGEIDIMERLNGESIAYQTVHSYYTQVLHKGDNPPKSGTGPICPDEFNTYAVEMHSDSIVFFINDRRTLTYPRLSEVEDEGQFVFDKQPFYLLLDMQLGGSWVGRVFPEDLPVEMEIDWVRYYSLNNPEIR